MTLNVSLTPQLEQFVRETVNSGRYQSASEVVRTALRLLEEQERQRQSTLDWLRQEIDRGLQSGAAEPASPTFWNRLRQNLQTPPAARGDDA
jgi:antitoxin ParD1/3/4